MNNEDNEVKDKDKKKPSVNFKRLFFPICVPVVTLIFIAVCAYTYAWFSIVNNPRTDRGQFVIKEFDINATLTVTFNDKPISVWDIQDLAFIAGDYLTYQIHIIEVDDAVMSFGVYLGSVSSSVLAIEKPNGGYYEMTDMYRMAYFDPEIDDFIEFSPVSAYPSAGGRIRVMTASRNSTSETFTVIFRIAFWPPDDVDFSVINELQNQVFSFEEIRLLER
jgi:hypothetical protein